MPARLFFLSFSLSLAPPPQTPTRTKILLPPPPPLPSPLPFSSPPPPSLAHTCPDCPCTASASHAATRHTLGYRVSTLPSPPPQPPTAAARYPLPAARPKVPTHTRLIAPASAFCSHTSASTKLNFCGAQQPDQARPVLHNQPATSNSASAISISTSTSGPSAALAARPASKQSVQCSAVTRTTLHSTPVCSSAVCQWVTDHSPICLPCFTDLPTDWPFERTGGVTD